MPIKDFIIRDYQEIEKLKQKYNEQYKISLERIYLDLMYLRKGDSYCLERCWKDVPEDLKVGICCLFIMENSSGEYVFNNAFTHIFRR